MKQTTGCNNTTLLELLATVSPKQEYSPISMLTGYEAGADQKLSEAIAAMNELAMLLDVSECCLTLEGAAKDVHVAHFELLSGMAYTEEGVGDVIGNAVALVGKAISNIKYFFTEYIGESIRGNRSRAEQLLALKAELEKLSIEELPSFRLPWNRVFILGNNILDETNNIGDIYRATSGFVASCTATAKELAVLAKTGQDYDYASVQKIIEGFVILTGKTNVLYQKTYELGFFNYNTEVSNPDVLVYPRVLEENGKVMSIQEYSKFKLKTLIANIDVWVELIKWHESVIKKATAITESYDVMAAAIKSSKDKAFIKQVQGDIAKHTAYVKRVVNFNQESISEMAALLLQIGKIAKKAK